MKVCVVGGGTAGLITATILKEFLDIDVQVIYSSKIGIVGVGEGSTEHFTGYMNFVGINQVDIIKECDATYKAGIFFEDWSENPYLHYVGQPFNDRYAQYNYTYAYQISRKDPQVVPQSILDNKIHSLYLSDLESPPFYQFHFNTHKLNLFLQNFAKNKKIDIVDDDIQDVVLDSSGNIKKVVGEKGSYSADFFIDATGFKKMLIGKMNPKWNSFKDFLKMKSAVVFPTPSNEEYALYTKAKAMKYGWCFTLPVWGRNGNGYIFDSDYISVDEAKDEVTQVFGNVDFGKEFNFDPGYLEDSWIKNCAAVGLSSAFVEPLEATSIGTTIQQSFLLMHKIANYSEKDIKEYNRSFKTIMENIRDFIFLHYMTKKNETDFWVDVSKISPPDSLSEKLDSWKNRLPMYEDFSLDSNYTLFKDANFIVVMHGLNLFDTQEIKKEFDLYPERIKNLARERVLGFNTHDKDEPKLSHKEMIQRIRGLPQ
jgi:tryptophan halogenase